MELWIRSQNRTKLERLDNYLRVQETSVNPHSHWWGVLVDGEYYAEYNSEERALEVLDEIMELLKDEEILHIRKSSLNTLDEMAEPKYILKPVGQPRVYEMPLE